MLALLFLGYSADANRCWGSMHISFALARNMTGKLGPRNWLASKRVRESNDTAQANTAPTFTRIFYIKAANRRNRRTISIRNNICAEGTSVIENQVE